MEGEERELARGVGPAMKVGRDGWRATTRPCLEDGVVEPVVEHERQAQARQRARQGQDQGEGQGTHGGMVRALVG